VLALIALALWSTGCSGGQRGSSGAAVPTDVELEWPDAAVPEPTRDAAIQPAPASDGR
jgi:hypothetical protein